MLDAAGIELHWQEPGDDDAHLGAAHLVRRQPRLLERDAEGAPRLQPIEVGQRLEM